MEKKTNVAVFASGGGSNFQALIDKKNEGKLHVNFTLLVGNNSKAKAFDRARACNIPTLHIAPSHFSSEEKYTRKLLNELTSRNIDLIILAGYMKIIPKVVVQQYHNRIVNIHPALLPSFGGEGMYGKNVHQAVLTYGAKVTGITVHVVDEEYDKGPIVLQKTTHIMDTDTPDSLAERVLTIEHANYWRAVEALAHDHIRIEGRKVIGTV